MEPVLASAIAADPAHWAGVLNETQAQLLALRSENDRSLQYVGEARFKIAAAYAETQKYRARADGCRGILQKIRDHYERARAEAYDEARMKLLANAFHPVMPMIAQMLHVFELDDNDVAKGLVE